MAEARPLIAIVAVGDVRLDLRRLLPALEKSFPARKAHLGIGNLPHPNEAYSPRRRQYHVDAIVDGLERLESDAERVLGVADLDVYSEPLNFVFGLARGRAAVIALARLRPEFWGQPADDE